MNLEWLALGMSMRSNNGGTMNDVQEAIRLHREALALCPPGHRDRSMTLHNLGYTSIVCFRDTGDVSHLEDAAKMHVEGLELRGEGHPERPRSLLSLGTVLLHRYYQLGDTRDLNEGIRMYQESVPLCSPGHIHRALALNNSASALQIRYQLHGLVDDLEQSTKVLRKSLSICQPGNSMRDMVSNNLTQNLRVRFSLLGDESDIKEAIMLIREALEHRSGDATLLLTLTQSLREAYEQYYRMQDLDEAINVQEAWIRKQDTGVDTASLHLVDLAELLLLRAKVIEDLDGLNRAAELCQRALDLLQPRNLVKHHILRVYSDVLRRRFFALNVPSDAHEALARAEEALALLSPSNAERALCLFTLSRLYLTRDTPFYSQGAAIHIFREAMENSHCNPQLRLRHGVDILEMMEQTQNGIIDGPPRVHLLDSYRLTIDLLPRVAYFGLDARTRLRVLTKAEGLAINGAANAVLAGQPEIAVELLEEGRAVFWNQHLRLRT